MKKKLLFTVFIGLLLLNSCEREVDIYRFKADNNIIRFEFLEKNTIIADSASCIKFVIKINSNADSAYRIVLLSTQLGHFSNLKDSVILHTDMYGYATGWLFGNTQEGAGLLSAQVDQYRIDSVITFAPALPDDIILTVNKTKANNIADSIQVEVVLSRAKGFVSDNIKVFFSLSNTSNEEFETMPVVLPFQYSKNQRVHAVIRNPYQSTGKFILRCEVKLSDQTMSHRDINLMY